MLGRLGRLGALGVLGALDAGVALALPTCMMLDAGERAGVVDACLRSSVTHFGVAVQWTRKLCRVRLARLRKGSWKIWGSR